MRQNVLDKEASPYLLQHKDNPVQWQSWGREALEVAQREDKPVLLSIGYSACHWCHVMAHESFEDPETAGLMNELFVNIKVDREERPDLDAIYQLALAVMGQPGGWPLTMFLTPKAEPFWGGTYFPPTRRFGRPGLREVLRAVHDAYKNHPEKVTQNTTALRRALQEELRNRKGDGVDRELRDQAARRLLREVDMRFGGLGLAPKFPVPNMLETLWRHWRRSGDEAARAAVTLSVERMCMGGIYDHLGGGFARYATDQRWLVPHFEKMLYDNALLLELMTHLWQDMKNPLFAVRIEETVDWVLREMTTHGGAFASALDADSEGEEGKFYVWDEAEVDRLLGEDSEEFKRIYDVTAEGNWEGRNILHRLGQNGLSEPETERRLARLRGVLFEAREKRQRPSWDDSVLVDWNGLMIAALASAGTVFENAAWLAASMHAFDFITTEMEVDGRLCHSGRQGRVKRVGFLDDYANMARAALLLHELTGTPDYLARAEQWAAILDTHYWDAENGGYFYTPDDSEAVITRAKTARDQATPSGNGVMVEVLARLFYLTGKESYRERAASLVAAFAGEVPLNLPIYATLINNNELLEEAIQIVIMGEREARDTRGLLHAVFDVSLPNRVLMVTPPGASLPRLHPAAGKTSLQGEATAYVCRGTSCSLPMTEPEELKESLLRPTHSGT